MFKELSSSVNMNTLQGNKWEFGIVGVPELKYFGTGIPIPGVSLPPAQRESPLSTMYFHGDKLEFEPLNITFTVDEELKVWVKTFKWMNGLAPAVNRGDYARQAAKGKYFEGFLNLYNNSWNESLSFKFVNCHPTSLSPIELEVSTSDQVVLKSSLTLQYDYFQIIEQEA